MFVVPCLFQNCRAVILHFTISKENACSCSLHILISSDQGIAPDSVFVLKHFHRKRLPGIPLSSFNASRLRRSHFRTHHHKVCPPLKKNSRPATDTPIALMQLILTKYCVLLLICRNIYVKHCNYPSATCMSSKFLHDLRDQVPSNKRFTRSTFFILCSPCLPMSGRQSYFHTSVHSNLL